MTTIAQSKTKLTLPPGPKGLPYVGNLLEFRRDQLGFLQQLQQTYAKMATIYIGSTPVVLLFRPEHVRYVLTENPRNFTSREVAAGLRELIGDGLLTIDGEAHRQQRRLVQPAFHKKRVESYANIMVQYTQEMLNTWHVGDRLDIARAMQELTLHIVAQCLFNIDLASQVDELGNAFTDMIGNPVGLAEGFLNLRIDQPFTSYGKRMAAKRRVDAFIYELIAQRRAAGRDVGDVLSMLLAAQGGEDALSDTQVRDHIMTFVAAGHETTANALTWTFYLLAEYPEVREKLLNELQTVLAGRAPTGDDIANLPYTEWVLNESMRLYPPAWTQGRRAVEAFELDGYYLPAGTMVMFSQWVIHRLPDIWGDPDVFRPERWDPVNGQKVLPWSYFPFGGGPRICIGMPFAQLEAKLLLATILQQYTPLTRPGYRMELRPLITLRPKNGLPVTLLPTVSDRTTTSWEHLLQVPAVSEERGIERRGCRGAFTELFGLLRF
ncbi:MAG: cytochrome P450 [Ktedonobacteraceae bacterium]